jgi:hypothetical protein
MAWMAWMVTALSWRGCPTRRSGEAWWGQRESAVAGGGEAGKVRNAGGERRRALPCGAWGWRYAWYAWYAWYGAALPPPPASRMIAGRFSYQFSSRKAQRNRGTRQPAAGRGTRAKKPVEEKDDEGNDYEDADASKKVSLGRRLLVSVNMKEFRGNGRRQLQSRVGVAPNQLVASGRA